MGVSFVALAPFLVCFAVVACWRNANLAGGFACRRFWWCVFLVCFMICRGIMEPRSFMKFLICLLAYPNVRTEPQSEIGRNRGKKTPATQSAAASRAPKPDPSAPRSAMSAYFFLQSLLAWPGRSTRSIGMQHVH